MNKVGLEMKSSDADKRNKVPRVTEPAITARPSCGEVNKFSPSKAKNFDLPNVTEDIILEAPEFLFVQLMPSGEVRIVPLQPVATKWAAPLVMADKWFVVPEFLRIQLMPSGEVSMVPSRPTATNWDPP